MATQTSDLKTAPDGAKPEDDIRRAIMIKPDLVRVVNIEFNKAIVSYRSHTDIFFFERYDYDPAEIRPPISDVTRVTTVLRTIFVSRGSSPAERCERAIWAARSVRA